MRVKNIVKVIRPRPHKYVIHQDIGSDSVSAEYDFEEKRALLSSLGNSKIQSRNSVFIQASKDGIILHIVLKSI